MEEGCLPDSEREHAGCSSYSFYGEATKTNILNKELKFVLLFVSLAVDHTIF